jgi:two-component system sensor histidine kinase QseC
MNTATGVSLKSRILALAMTSITLVWISAALLTYSDAKEELDEVLDAQLAQSATLLVAQAAHELDEIDTGHAILLHKYSRHIAVQIWEDGMVLRMRSTNAPEQPLGNATPGYRNINIAGKEWRVFSTWDNSRRVLIHIGEERVVRANFAREIALHMLYPLAYALPLLALFLWLAVSRGMRPLAHLAREIAQRQPDNLAPVDAFASPPEVKPLIDRLNGLFERISKLIENERRFTSDAAHELRTPIAAIKAQVQVACGASSEAERLHALDGAISGCDRATHLIAQLLTLARIENLDTGTLQRCDLRVLAMEVIADMAPAALDRDVQIELVEGGDATVRGLPALLRVMLRNLLDNAVRHTPVGTQVQVRILTEQGAHVLVVSDDGPGLAEEELSKIAQRFYRPQGTIASGSGLGLSIVQRIVEIHGAELRFSCTSYKRGLSISITFPS